MGKANFFLFFPFFLLIACSNSEPFEGSPISEDSTDKDPVALNIAAIDSDFANVEKDSSAIVSDSASVKKDSSAIASDSACVKKDATNKKGLYLQVEQNKLIPNAVFTKKFALRPPQTQDTVRCTFDGSEPDTSTQVFTEEKLIDSTTVVRCSEFRNGKITRKQTETYFIDENINMPVVSISVAPIYVQDYLDASPCKPDPCKEAKFWEDIEYPTHVEYFAEGSSSKDKTFEIDAGISIAGNYSRNQEKKSVAIKMKKEYQSGKLHYPLFETRPEKSKFKAFVLRNNGNRFVSDYIGDPMATSLLEGTNVDYQRSRQVIVFYNGNYHGIYDMREKLNEHFVETNYGIDNNGVDFIKISYNKVEAQNGSSDDYLSLMQFITSTDFENNNTAYESVSEKINIVNYMEYMAAEIFYANGDWPHNNIRAWKFGNSPWKFIAYDIDHGFDWTGRIKGFTANTNMINWIIDGGKPNAACSNGADYRCFPNIFAKLIQNSDFKQAFINRASYLYSTFINSTKINKQIDYINGTIDKSQIARDQKRYNRPNYNNECGNGFETDGSCLKTWSANRDKTVRTDFKESLGLNEEVPITIEVKGNGKLKLDNFDILQSSKYNWTVFEGHPMKLSIVCPSNSASVAWEDGSTNPDRIIEPIKDAVYTAECQ